MIAKPRATIEDLYRVDGKAELVNGEIVHLMSTGGKPGYAGDAILYSLFGYVLRTGKGVAVGDNKGFVVDLPHRESFSPDTAYYTGSDPDMRFYQGPPAFAVEVRSESDYGSAAEREMAAKRQDYFRAGTKVVWDVDLLSTDVIRKYTFDRPAQPQMFRREDVADAEPAVPGWAIAVDDLFKK